MNITNLQAQLRSLRSVRNIKIIAFIICFPPVLSAQVESELVEIGRAEFVRYLGSTFPNYNKKFDDSDLVDHVKIFLITSSQRIGHEYVDISVLVLYEGKGFMLSGNSERIYLRKKDLKKCHKLISSAPERFYREETPIDIDGEAMIFMQTPKGLRWGIIGDNLTGSDIQQLFKELLGILLMYS